MTHTALPSGIPIADTSSFKLWRSFAEFYGKRSRLAAYTDAVLLVGLIGFLDYLTGYEVAFYPFYFIPIFLMVWFHGKRAALGVALLSSLASYLADRAAGHVYSLEWLRIWEAVVRLIFFFLVIVAGLGLRRQRDFNRAQLEVSERLRRMEKELINTSEREQVRIGRDLHDGLCQYLVAISYTAGLLQQDLEKEASKKAATAGEIADLLHDAVVRTRDVARGLSPVDSDEDGLASALEGLASQTSRLMGVSCSVIYPRTIEIADNSQAVHLFRIAQEAVANAIKHGNAQSVIIALESADGELSLRISDDGVGFDPTKVDKGGMGLNTMRYRAHAVGGRLDIDTNTPNGTVITCTVEKEIPSLLQSPTYHL